MFPLVFMLYLSENHIKIISGIAGHGVANKQFYSTAIKRRIGAKMLRVQHIGNVRHYAAARNIPKESVPVWMAN